MLVINILYQFLLFLLFQQSYDDFVTNVLLQLTAHNIIFVKIFQALSSNNHVSERTLANFRRCTNNAQYYENDVDYLLLDKIQSKYNIQLCSANPINSGMIALVFKGKMADGQCVAIKIKRRDVYNKLLRGYNDFVWWFNILRNVFPYIGLGDVLESISSLVDSKDYIMTQCNFKEEMAACNLFREKMKETADIGVLTGIDRIVIPRIYNSDDDDQFIIMEYLEGKICFDIEDKYPYLALLVTFGMSTLYIHNISHTDLHPGNVICMKDNKLGIIDFGMHLQTEKRIMESLIEITKMVAGLSGGRRDYAEYGRYVLEPVPDFSHFTEQQLSDVNDIVEKLFTELLQGKLTEKSIRKHKSNMDAVAPQLSSSKFNSDMVKILLSNTMINATCFHFTDDIGVISDIQKRVIHEIFS